MDTGLLRASGLIGLAPDEVLRLRDGAGRHIGVVRGVAWVTQDGDPRDYVLGSGESLRLERDGLVLVMPLGGEAKLVLEEGLAAASAVAQPEFSPRGGDTAYFKRRAHLLRAEAMAQAVAALGAGLKALWHRIGRSWRARARAQRTAAELRRLSDRMLQDIGLRRDQVDCAARLGPC